MKILPDTFKNFNNRYGIIQNSTQQENLKGFLLNNIIKKEENNYIQGLNSLSNNLLITDVTLEKQPKKEKEENNFDSKKILKPLFLTSASIILGTVFISKILKGYSSKILNKTNSIQPEDLARNMNILEEPEFAMFRALREPSSKNILGLIGVSLMSAFTLGAKSFIDGYCEVWTKKQECNINHSLQKDLISVEAQAFSGKLNFVNELLKEKSQYFTNVFSNKNNINFKGDNNLQENKEEENKKQKIKNNLVLGFGIVSLIGLSFGLFKNFQKTVNNFDKYEQDFKNKLINSDKLEIFSLDDKQTALKRLQDVLISTKADDKTIEADVKQIKNITQKEIQEFIDKMKNLQIYSNADKAIYGTSGKIQYYCYINENRGHLYNWILNPENQFNKYLFLSFSTISSIGYIAKSAVGAIKNVAVLKENSKSELSLREKLIDVEIENFKAKKLSAINPLIEDFKIKLNSGKYSKEELYTLAQNILIEIKNGPPYVYA